MGKLRFKIAMSLDGYSADRSRASRIPSASVVSGCMSGRSPSQPGGRCTGLRVVR
jgi:hypothetical protein